MSDTVPASHYFEPDADRARSCREAMERALWSSVRSLLAEATDTQTALPARTMPGDFGAYFDLALPWPGGAPLSLQTQCEARKHLALRLAGAAQPDWRQTEASTHTVPSISTLSPAFHSPDQIARYCRWWDIEPENTMDLARVGDEELARAGHEIGEALAALRQCAPELSAEVRAVVSEIVVARPSGGQRLDFSGVSSFALWGAIAVNLDAHQGWPSYFRTVVHEAAHNLLFAFARNQPLVADDPARRRASPLRNDPRPLDGIYHAAFVSARESLALDRLLSWNARGNTLAESEVAVVEDLLESSVLAFWSCADTLREGARLSALGETVLAECEQWMQESFAIADV